MEHIIVPWLPSEVADTKCPSYIRRHKRPCKSHSRPIRSPRKQHSCILWCRWFVPHEEGIETMTEYLKTRENKTVSTNSLCNLGSIVLKNYFELSSKIYHQKLGTAIGTKFAPPYANLFMAVLEKRIFENSGYHPYLWLRFLDDIFCIWTDGLEKLKEFFKFLNAFHPTIKFTMDNSYETINFLDVQVSKRNSTFETNLHCKDTDRHQYLYLKSCHRYVYKKYIPFGQAIRLRWTISGNIVLDERLKEVETWFTNRHEQGWLVKETQKRDW